MQSLCQQSFTASQLHTREATYTPSSESAVPPAYEPPHEPASPVLNQQSPWWETEARKIVCSGQIEPIYQLLRFRFYGQKDSLHDALQLCETSRLNEIFARLTDEGTNPDCQHKQMVEEIVELVEPTCPSLNLVWPWEPRQAKDLDVEQIADVIDQGSHSLLAHVPFEDCLRHALDYTERSVESLVCQHRCIAFRIRCYLREHPTVTETYRQVEQKLQHRNPLAHQAVRYGLLPDTPTDFCLDLICEPLRSFVEDPTLSLGAILTRLPILAVRFDCSYRRIFFPLWRPPFTIGMDTFDTLIASSLPLEYARKMTISDRSDFDPLNLETLKARGPQLQYLFQNSDSFRDAIAECGKAYPKLNHRLNEIAQGLYTYSNWHRLAALVYGQRLAGLDSIYSSLFAPTGNFAVCRSEMKKRPGLPFLVPYLRPDYPTGDAVIFEVLSNSRAEALLVQSITKPSLFRRYAGRMHRTK